MGLALCPALPDRPGRAVLLGIGLACCLLAGRLVIVVVFDEGETTDVVPFVIMAPGVSGVIARRPANHYALTRLIDEVAGTPPLRQASGAPDLAPAFGLAP
jgi:hypothetical protein